MSDGEQDSLVFAPQSCPSLEELTLSFFSFNQQEQIAGAGAGVFTLINRNCKHLCILSLEYCELSPSIIRIIAGIESLKDLNFSEREGLTDAVMAVLATMKLVKLCISGRYHGEDDELTAASMQSFVGSNISQTLEAFTLIISSDNTTPVDDVQVARAFASCHNLKKLVISFGEDVCVFGRGSLDGLQAMATGCPLLADVYMYLTVPGLHYLGAHSTNLKECYVYNRPVAGAEGFPSTEELRTLYPAVKWRFLHRYG
jgi:hypothetical protein